MIKKKKKRDWNKGKHFGIRLNMSVYHPRRNLTQQDIDEFMDAYVELVERFGWYTGGGASLLDMNSDED